MNKNNAFAMQAPVWAKEIKDEKVRIAVVALIFSHTVGGEQFTEDGLKKELADLGSLSESQQKEAYDLIIAHKK